MTNFTLLSLLLVFVVNAARWESSVATIQCVRNCRFLTPLNHGFDLPLSCTERISSNGCFTIIIIDYMTGNVSVSFLTEGSEQQKHNAIYLIEQTVELTFYTKHVKREINTFCFTANCDIDYAKRTIDYLKQLNHQPIFDELSPKLFIPTGTSLSQCYNTNNQPRGCVGKLCEASVPSKASDPGSKQCEQEYNLSFVNIEINTYRAYPSAADYDDNDYEITCNMDLCNGGQTTKDVQEVINKYSKQLSPPPPLSSSSKRIFMTNNNIFNVVFACLLVYII
ncbi:unnamed protein product [Didymodactylos carnosus]|uniref:Sodefrin-like factor n=1 Tax=Didymodactylos carnosus TaxID=1234261 RepID=A0A8S2FN25_9BILA|nr:unnamed protein product [Didymodactylos carnosus]CAF4301775.1 unnamed protein product [Didymodactylos carnosus]